MLHSVRLSLSNQAVLLFSDVVLRGLNIILITNMINKLEPSPLTAFSYI